MGVVRRAVGNHDQLRAGVARRGGRTRAPDVLADDDADPNAIDIDDARIDAGGEVALLVEDGVIRQALLAIDAGDLSIAEDRDGVIAPARRELRESDEHSDAFDAGGDARQLVRACREKCRTQQQVLRWVTAERQFRRDQEVRATALRFANRLDDARCISGEIADDLIELSDRNPHSQILPCAHEDKTCRDTARTRQSGFAPNPRMPPTTLRVIESLANVPAHEWNALVGDAPLLSHAFLHALHESGCASPETGWTPRYLTAWQSGSLAGAMPLYIKAHSYGEYVFDWSWADAYRRHGRRYYPKLLCAIPFTPATGQRLIAGTTTLRRQLLDGALALLEDRRLSSLHILFPESADAEVCERGGLLMRESVQFHWTNPGYASFDDFLASMNHAKRKTSARSGASLPTRALYFAGWSDATSSPSTGSFSTAAMPRPIASIIPRRI